MKDKQSILKQAIPHISVLVFFVLIVLVYFYPAFEGKVLQQSDVVQFRGAAQEVLEYGKSSGWTGSMFSGMPTYHITGYEPSFNLLSWVNKYIIHAVHSESAGPIFFLLVMSYIMFLVLGAKWWQAALGAVATAFSSYNIIILAAGHITKAWALAFVPLTLAGVFLVFQRKYWPGFIVFTLGLTFLIISNHLQITYYTAIFCLILFIGYIIKCIRDKDLKRLGISTGVLAAGVALALLTNLSGLYINYESGQESMRSSSELTLDGDNASGADSQGLDKGYVFDWSYGKSETLTLMIPNAKGGASGGTLGRDSHLYKALRDQGMQVGKEIQAPTFWGEKPFTSGPVYFGAIICFLFLLSFFIVPKGYKWWLLGAAVFFIILAWGKNLAWFNDLMYYYFPYYSKFRAVETALVIPAFIFPIMAILGIKELFAGNLKKEKLVHALYWSGGITAGICFILWMMPGVFFNFESTYDAQYGLPQWYFDALYEDRKDLLQADALRSMIFILLSAGLVYMTVGFKNKKTILPVVAAGLVVLVLADMWQVDKRYLNNDNFVSKRSYNEQMFPKSLADEYILRDPDPSYRVLKLGNPFQDAQTSYYHKSIGGYHAAKLGRYQDLIKYRLTKEINSVIASFSTAIVEIDITDGLINCPTLNMLNTRYIIYNPEQPPLVNDYAFGNAWFVDSYRFVGSANDEMLALDTIDPRTEAVFNREFEENLQGLRITPDPDAHIEMTDYKPDRVAYRSQSAREGLAVFSEIYYEKGWKAYIDGQQIPVSRADWLLRAITIPPGSHEIVFEFDPDRVKTVGMVSTVSSILLFVLIIAGIVYYVVRRKK